MKNILAILQILSTLLTIICTLTTCSKAKEINIHVDSINIKMNKMDTDQKFFMGLLKLNNNQTQLKWIKEYSKQTDLNGYISVYEELKKDIK